MTDSIGNFLGLVVLAMFFFGMIGVVLHTMEADIRRQRSLRPPAPLPEDIVAVLQTARAFVYKTNLTPNEESANLREAVNRLDRGH